MRKSAHPIQAPPLFPLVSAVLARGVLAEIPLFFFAAEIAAAKMLLFFRKSAAMDILTKRGATPSAFSTG